MDRGGAETMVMNYYRHIDRTKVQFDFLVHREQRGAYDDEIESMGGKIYRMCPVYPQNFARYKRDLHSFFQSHPEYKIIHSHMSELGYFAFSEAKRQGIPVRICHAHNAPHGFDMKMIMRTYFKKRMMPYVTHLFMCGIDSGRWLYGKQNEDRFIMLNNAIDVQTYTYDSNKRIEMRRQLNLTDDLVIGHVGRFNPQKNHPFLINIFAALLRREPNAVLLLVGGGEGMSKMQEKAQELGIAEHVRFLGVRSDVADLMQAMDVFVFPSLYEGLGIALIEAQAAGLPCVVSDTIPHEAYLTDLVDSESLSAPAEKWAEKILAKRAIPRTDRRAEIAAHGFDITTEAVKLQEFYLKAYEQNC
ncbi:MAG: glycosyl transferase family 1 [Clostridia bacterium]|nr:MAG: glycosyl transferase family 1 [Clostridia bacterium]